MSSVCLLKKIPSRVFCFSFRVPLLLFICRSYFSPRRLPGLRGEFFCYPAKNRSSSTLENTRCLSLRFGFSSPLFTSLRTLMAEMPPKYLRACSSLNAPGETLPLVDFSVSVCIDRSFQLRNDLPISCQKKRHESLDRVVEWNYG